ncbi:MAG TPA: hypothetical protein VK750_05050 [Cytophagaceae bacterium]|jgi:hypothetical protein|nr:hypothetical protein [Cytophagaceae bacterium]
MKESSVENSKIETLLVAGSIVPQLLTFILGSEVDSYWLFAASMVFLLLLIGYYVYCYASSKKALVLLLMATALMLDLYLKNESSIGSMRIGVRCALGIWMLIFALREIVKTKSFEMLALISALFLLLNAVLYFPIVAEENVPLIILFGSTFTLATLVYYENLWDQYDAIEKKWVIVCLLTLLIDVFVLSKDLF